MWTSKNRGRYDRSKLRYPSDLTDDEWGLVEPLIRQARLAVASARDHGEWGERRCTFSRPAVSGARSRKTCRREARSTTTSICGHMTARWNESTRTL